MEGGKDRLSQVSIIYLLIKLSLSLYSYKKSMLFGGFEWFENTTFEELIKR